MSEEEKIEHQKRMLKHLQLQKKKLAASTSSPSGGRGEGGGNGFDIETATKFELDKELIRKRIWNVDRKTIAVELDLARIREDLIERDLCIKQLSFLLIAMRQKLLVFPTTYARRLLHKGDVKEIHAILQNGIHEILNDLKNLPLQVTDPDWLETLDEES